MGYGKLNLQLIFYLSIVPHFQDIEITIDVVPALQIPEEKLDYLLVGISPI